MYYKQRMAKIMVPWILFWALYAYLRTQASQKTNLHVGTDGDTREIYFPYRIVGGLQACGGGVCQISLHIWTGMKSIHVMIYVLGSMKKIARKNPRRQRTVQRILSTAGRLSSVMYFRPCNEVSEKYDFTCFPIILPRINFVPESKEDWRRTHHKWFIQ